MKVNNNAPEFDIQPLIDELSSSDGLERQRARLLLVSIGPKAGPALADALNSADEHTRWEAAKALTRIVYPPAAPSLVALLEDENPDIRWAASEALITLGRPGLKPLLERLITGHSTWLREGARHILHVLRDFGQLRPEEEKVLKAMQGLAPDIEVGWAASAALENLELLES